MSNQKKQMTLKKRKRAFLRCTPLLFLEKQKKVFLIAVLVHKMDIFMFPVDYNTIKESVRVQRRINRSKRVRETSSQEEFVRMEGKRCDRRNSLAQKTNMLPYYG